MGQNFARMGAHDIRKDAVGDTDFRIRRQLRSYAKTDAPPKRVKPVPITIILHLLKWAFGAGGTGPNQATVDMIVIAFYFLLRPGEYTGTTSDDAPFLMRDVQLFLGRRQLNVMDAPLADIERATSASLVFTDQKNNVRNEVLNHGLSGHAHACPTKALVRRVVYLRLRNAPATTPIASFWRGNRRVAIKNNDITVLLRTAATLLFPETGLAPDEISARSLRAGGAMALLCGNIDTNLIKMIGRWHSDAMMRYLHLQAQPLMRHYAKKMFHEGTYTFLPHETVPIVG